MASSPAWNKTIGSTNTPMINDYFALDLPRWQT
jgi:hypothetical protein